MQVYQTNLMDRAAADDFAAWFDSEIGTEFEISVVDQQHYVMGYDLLPQEIGLCRAYEQGKDYPDYNYPDARDLELGRVDSKGWKPEIQREIHLRDFGREHNAI